jgi:glycosyltransferase involved in cell wall biosynthesis
LGLTQLEHWAHHGVYFRNGHPALAEVELVKYYNAADLYLSTSLGEGWGLGITEALASGCPVAIPNHTACREIGDTVNARYDEAGLQQPALVLPVETDYLAQEQDNSRLRRRVDVVGAASLIAEAWKARHLFKQRHPLPGAVEQWLSWDRIAQAMLRSLRKAQPRPLPVQTSVSLEAVR